MLKTILHSAKALFGRSLPEATAGSRRTGLGCALVLGAIGLFGLSPAAKADTLLVSFDNSLSSGNTFVYDLSLSPTGDLQTGNGFTLFNFDGYQSSTYSGLPLGDTWTESAGALNPAVLGLGLAAAPVFGVVPDGNNISFSFTGTRLTGPSTVSLGTISVVSLYTNRAGGVAVTQDSSTNGQAFAFGPITVASQPANFRLTPLPTSLAGGLGLMGLALCVPFMFRAKRAEASL